MFEILAGLHDSWMPHAGQVPIGHSMFYEGCKDIFVDAGRNGGKTDFLCYAFWRFAMENPGTENYLFEPQQKQAREILWASGRMQNFGPKEWVSGVNNTEMRVTFKNGSFIKIDGSENYESYRGVKPSGLSGYDEVKDMKRKFFDAYEPNRAAKNTPAIWIGTPPEFPNHYDEIAQTVKDDPTGKFFWFPSWTNPHISLSFILKKFRQYKASGDIETWLREYAGLPIRGGKSHIFPQWLRYKTRPKDSLIPRSWRGWSMIIGFDPSTSGRFGVLFCLFNEFSKKLIVIDEILETTMGEMTARKIYSRTEKIRKEYKDLGCKDFRYVYDEAAAWFMNEIYEIPNCDWGLEKSEKSLNDANQGISIIRTLFDLNLIEVADHLAAFKSDFDGYVKDEKGRLPRDNDEMPDILRYICHALGYDLEELENKLPDPDLMRRGHSLEEDLLEMQNLMNYAEIGQEVL